jgi:hypothetical protein
MAVTAMVTLTMKTTRTGFHMRMLLSLFSIPSAARSRDLGIRRTERSSTRSVGKWRDSFMQLPTAGLAPPRSQSSECRLIPPHMGCFREIARTMCARYGPSTGFVDTRATNSSAAALRLFHGLGRTGANGLAVLHHLPTKAVGGCLDRYTGLAIVTHGCLVSFWPSARQQPHGRDVTLASGCTFSSVAFCLAWYSVRTSAPSTTRLSFFC